MEKPDPPPPSSLLLPVPGGSTKTAMPAGDTLVNLLINLSGISGLQPLRKVDQSPSRDPMALPDKEVWNNGSVK